MTTTGDWKDQQLEQLSGLFADYPILANTYDELFSAQGKPHKIASSIIQFLDTIATEQYESYQQVADDILRKNGITFTVYTDKGNLDKIFPFDLIPRVISAKSWKKIDKGLVQRVAALNAFLDDI